MVTVINGSLLTVSWHTHFCRVGRFKKIKNKKQNNQDVRKKAKTKNKKKKERSKKKRQAHKNPFLTLSD